MQGAGRRAPQTGRRHHRTRCHQVGHRGGTARVCIDHGGAGSGVAKTATRGARQSRRVATHTHGVRYHFSHTILGLLTRLDCPCMAIASLRPEREAGAPVAPDRGVEHAYGRRRGGLCNWRQRGDRDLLAGAARPWRWPRFKTWHLRGWIERIHGGTRQR